MHSESQSKIQRLFLSVGAMKAGTTWLYDKLRQHPDIYFTPLKEVHFFAHYYGKSSILEQTKRDARACHALSKSERSIGGTTDYDNLTKWYSRYRCEPVDYLWLYEIMEQGIKKEQYVSDFSNLGCFLDIKDWEDVRNHVDKLRVIYILRDPLSRIWSHFKFHLQFSKHINALQPDKDFALFQRILNKPWFWRNTLYSNQIKKLTSSLDHKELSILFFEDMVKSPDEFLCGIENFLDIKPITYKGPINEIKNKSIATEFPSKWREYAHSLLVDEIALLKRMGYWHCDWQ